VTPAQAPPAGQARSGRRVLIVSNLFPPHVVGGAEIVAHRQALRLRERGHEVSVFAGWVAPDDQAGRLDRETVDGLRVWRTPVVSFDPDDNFFVPSVAARLRAVIEAERPDVVHLHNLSGLGFSLVPLVSQLGARAVVTLHDHSGYCHRATALRPDDRLCDDAEACAPACRGAIRPRALGIDVPMRLRRDYVARALSRADRLISPSRALAASMRASGAIETSRLDMVSNGIDLAPFRALTPRPAGAAAGPVRFITIAYLGEHKGILDLLAAAELLAADPALAGRWTLAIAGDGLLRARVEEAVASGRLGGAVTYLGRLPHPRILAELARTDVLVLPSRWPENEPVVLLEAIAAGVATLATAVGGIPDLVEAGRTGELVPPSAPGALAAAMAAYIRDPARARAQGEANLARRDRFTEDAAITAIEAIHDQVRRTPPAPGEARPLVLCAGDWPTARVAEICNNLHRLEQPGGGARLLWHAWADESDWRRVALLWNWSAGASDAAVRRALRAGVPILAPRGCLPVAGIEDCYAAALTYDSYLEGMVALARLPHDARALRRLRRGCREAADLLHASAPGPGFHLPTPVLGA